MAYIEDKVVKEVRENLSRGPEGLEQIRQKAEIAAAHYAEVIERKRASGDNVIHFAAYVTSDAVFGMEDVFRLMRDMPERWDAKMVVIPDMSRNYSHQKQTYLKAREYYTEHYGSDTVIDGWDIETDTFNDVTDLFDIIYFANPYDAMQPAVHSIEYASTRNVLPVYVNYGYDVGAYTMYSRMIGPELNLVWKYFTETVYSLGDCKKLQLFKGKNVVLTGYAKMDTYSKYRPKKAGSRKKILITPHHSVGIPELPFSNFMKYYGLIPKLPEMFPDMDFIFRPHPLLFIRLIISNIWTEDQVADYLAEVEKAGIEYSDGKDYFQIFADVDAMINDCGSFTVEWLFTGKPGCFVLSDDLKEEHMTTQMKEALTRYKIARSSEDIIEFISDVAAGRYPPASEMDGWVRDNIAVNYPHAAEKILEEMDYLK